MDQYVRPEGGILYSSTATPDAWVAEYVNEVVAPEDRLETHNRAISTGYRAIAAAKSNGGLMALSDQLYSSVEAAGEHATEIVKDVGKKLDDVTAAYLAPDGTFSKVLNEFAKSVDSKLDPNSQQMRELRASLERGYAALSKAAVEEYRAQMNLADEKSPFSQMYREIKGVTIKVAELKSHLEGQALLQQARQATPLVAGRSLEMFVNEVVAPIASVHGETFDDVRDVVSTTAERRKVGDFLTTIDGRLTRGATAKLVIEAKNRKSATVSSLLKELNEAMAARGAIAAIGILTNPAAKCRPITAYDGNKVIIALPGFGGSDIDYAYCASLIELGYEYGRLLAVARTTMMPTDTIDIDSIVQQIEEIAKAAKRFKELSDNHTRIISAVEAAKTTTTEIRDAIKIASENLRHTLQAELDRINGKKQLPPAA